MLNGIPHLLPPDLVKRMMEMGHGDEIVLGDGNFPAHSLGVPVVRMDGHGVAAVLRAVLALMPLDTYVDRPAALMQVVPGDDIVPAIWDDYRAILRERGLAFEPEQLERYAFYERARRACCVVATSEPRQYANILLKKGIVK
ncbi:MAG: fucose isomerase [Clostridiales bacterium]|nr:fucose isomerase [Clostridiales bacterium]